MQIVVVGLNHDTSPVAVRERLAFSESALPDALDRLRTKVQEGFLLSTCNRTEVYAFAGHAESGSQHLTRFLAKAGGLTVAELEAFPTRMLTTPRCATSSGSRPGWTRWSWVMTRSSPS